MRKICVLSMSWRTDMKKLFLTTIATVAVLVSASHAQLTLDIYEDYMSTPGQTNLIVHGFGTFNASAAGLASSTSGNSIYDFRPTAGAVLLGTSAAQPVNTYLNAISSINFGTMDINMGTLTITTENNQTFGLQGANLILPSGYAGEALNNRLVIENTTFADFGITETFSNQRNESLLNGQLNVNVIPEPGSVLLLTGSVVALTTIRRNKKAFTDYRKIDD